MQAARDGYPDLLRPDRTSWTKDSLNDALGRGEITAAEYARLYRLAAEREHNIDAALLATDISSLFALAYPEECGRDQVETVDVPTVGQPDPILAAIAAAREAERYANDTPEVDAPAGSPECRAQEEEVHRRTALADTAYWAVFDIMPSTPTGLIALTDFAVEARDALGQWQSGPDVLGVIRAAVAIHLGRVHEKPGPDPVFAVLERFRVMRAEYDAVFRKGAPFGSPEDDANEAVTECLTRAENDAWSEFVNTQPTSLAGLHAKIRFIGAEYGRFDPQKQGRRKQHPAPPEQHSEIRAAASELQTKTII